MFYIVGTWFISSIPIARSTKKPPRFIRIQAVFLLHYLISFP